VCLHVDQPFLYRQTDHRRAFLVGASSRALAPRSRQSPMPVRIERDRRGDPPCVYSLRPVVRETIDPAWRLPRIVVIDHPGAGRGQESRHGQIGGARSTSASFSSRIPTTTSAIIKSRDERRRSTLARAHPPLGPAASVQMMSWSPSSVCHRCRTITSTMPAHVEDCSFIHCSSSSSSSYPPQFIGQTRVGIIVLFYGTIRSYYSTHLNTLSTQHKKSRKHRIWAKIEDII